MVLCEETVVFGRYLSNNNLLISRVKTNCKISISKGNFLLSADRKLGTRPHTDRGLDSPVLDCGLKLGKLFQLHEKNTVRGTVQ